MEAAIAKGRSLPDWFLAEPPKSPLDPYVFDVFRELQTCRNYEMGPIPWDAIVNYGFTKGLDQCNVDMLCKLIRALDDAIIEEMHNKIDRQRKQQQQAGESPQKRRR